MVSIERSFAGKYLGALKGNPDYYTIHAYGFMHITNARAFAEWLRRQYGHTSKLRVSTGQPQKGKWLGKTPYHHIVYIPQAMWKALQVVSPYKKNRRKS